LSYDLEIGTHREPTREQVEAWAAEKALTVDADGLLVSDGSRHLFSLDGPVAAEPDDFAEPLAAACLAPRWMVTVNVPYSGPKRAISLARALARQLAEANEGAAYDPQEDALIWPRGTPKRVTALTGEEKTSRVELEWFVTPGRWPEAPEAMLRVLRRHCREALPARYGRVEPPPHRFDPDDPAAFVRFVLDDNDGDGFWFSGRPSFGGRWHAAHDDADVEPAEERYRVARLGIDFDGRVLAKDARWRAAVIDLFTAMAAELGAFFAAAQVETGWTVRKGNRPYASFDTFRRGGEHILRGSLWQGLPPVPLWLSWYGPPYRELVTPHMVEFSRPAGLRRLLGRARQDEARVDTRGGGLLVQLGEMPRPARELGGWPIPEALTYRARPPIVTRNSITGDPAQPEDAASVIPPLG
jgi:hypothetical protein